MSNSILIHGSESWFMEAKDGVCPGMECSLKKLDGAILILKNLHKHQLHDPVDFG